MTAPRPPKRALGPAVWDTWWQRALERHGFRVDLREWTHQVHPPAPAPVARGRNPQE